MRFRSGTIFTAFFVALAASPALALPTGIDQPRPGIPAPGPVAGAGLGFLLLAGGYYVVRRWRKQNSGE